MTRVIAGVSIAAAILLAASPITVRAITPDVGQVDAVTYAGYKVAPGEFPEATWPDPSCNRTTT